jgi:transposase
MVSVTKHVSFEELKELVRKQKDKHVHERLLFIHQLYLGAGVEKACERMCISNQTGYNWLDQWNDKGYEGLAPGFGGGRPSKLTKSCKEELKQKLKEKSCWLTKEIRSLIRKDFGVTYSVRHVERILHRMGMHYAKPYCTDYRQPGNAGELLSDAIDDAEITSGCIVGFLDQSSPQTTDNKQRFWSFGKPVMKRNTTKYRANTFGFYPFSGKEVVEFMEKSDALHMCEFLRKIRWKNPKKRIVLFLDNAMIHLAKITGKLARDLDITLVFLPTYSPDLNPIELIWKSVKRVVSQVFVKSERSFRETIRTTFHLLAKKTSFMRGWMETFLPGLL